MDEAIADESCHPMLRQIGLRENGLRQNGQSLSSRKTRKRLTRRFAKQLMTMP